MKFSALITCKSADRRSADAAAVVMRTAAGDIECVKSRRSTEIFESLRLSRQRSCEQAKQEGKTIVEMWKEQGTDTRVRLRNFINRSSACLIDHSISQY